MTDYSRGCAFIDGAYVPVAEAKLPLLDWGFLHSDATYDVVHVWNGRFFRLDDHLERFAASMRGLRLSPGIDEASMRDILHRCVRTSGLREAYVEMGCTRGLPEPGSRDPRSCRNRFFAFAIPFVWIADRERQADGINLVISQRQRIPPESVDPVVKNYHWLDLVMAQFDAYDAGGDNVVVVDARGNLVEGPGFNIFILRDGVAASPARGALQGITRRTVIEIAPRCGVDVRERDIAASEAATADEVFVTSTAGGVIPVTRIDGKALGGAKPGPVTLRLRDLYWELHDDPKYATAVDY